MAENASKGLLSYSNCGKIRVQRGSNVCEHLFVLKVLLRGIEQERNFSVMSLSKEQLEKATVIIQEHIKEQTAKSMIQFDKTLSTVVDKLEEKGWTLPTELGIYAVNAIGQTDEIKDVDKFLQWYFTEDDYEHFKNMIEGILEAPISEGIKKLVDECHFAFVNKKYAICADSLISVIEGILSSFWDYKTNIRMMKICQTKVDELSDDKEHLIKKYIWVSYNKFIHKLYEKNDFTKDEPSFINRHWLLHGRSGYEIEEVDCIRLFNAISSLCVIIKSEGKDNAPD